MRRVVQRVRLQRGVHHDKHLGVVPPQLVCQEPPHSRLVCCCRRCLLRLLPACIGSRCRCTCCARLCCCCISRFARRGCCVGTRCTSCCCCCCAVDPYHRCGCLPCRIAACCCYPCTTWRSFRCAAAAICHGAWRRQVAVQIPPAPAKAPQRQPVPAAHEASHCAV